MSRLQAAPLSGIAAISDRSPKAAGPLWAQGGIGKIVFGLGGKGVCLQLAKDSGRMPDVPGRGCREKGNFGSDILRRAMADVQAVAALAVSILAVGGIHVPVGQSRLHEVDRDVLGSDLLCQVELIRSTRSFAVK